jgi:hypothetical protein
VIGWEVISLDSREVEKRVRWREGHELEDSDGCVFERGALG